MRADLKEEYLFVLLSEYRPVVARDVDTSATRKYAIHGVIMQKRMKWFLYKEIFPFNKLHTNISRQLRILFQKPPMKPDFHTRLLE